MVTPKNLSRWFFRCIYKGTLQKCRWKQFFFRHLHIGGCDSRGHVTNSMTSKKSPLYFESQLLVVLKVIKEKNVTTILYSTQYHYADS